MSDDIARLVADLGQVQRVSPATARGIIRDVAEAAKPVWRSAASTGHTASDYASKISYNTYERSWGAEAEIGPTRGGRGSMGLLDDPLSTAGIRSTPSRARRTAASFIEGEIANKGRIQVDTALRGAGL